jgi:hypothetical protein
MNVSIILQNCAVTEQQVRNDYAMEGTFCGKSIGMAVAD